MSDDAIEELKKMSGEVLEEVDIALDIFETSDYNRLEELERFEDSVDEQEDLLIGNHVKRLMDGGCDPLAGVVFADIVTDLERCGDHAINIAYALKEKPKELYEGRVTDPVEYMESTGREGMKHDSFKHNVARGGSGTSAKYDKDRAHD